MRIPARLISPLPIFLLQLLLVFAACGAIRSGRIPLGIPGEWEWLRVRYEQEFLPALFAVVGLSAYAFFIALGYRSLDRGAGKGARAAWLAGLSLAAPILQGMIQEGAPSGHGLSKWAISLTNPGSSGYYTIARENAHRFDAFLSDYPDWIKTQGSLHIGTHPPGLFIEAYRSLKLMRDYPSLAAWVDGAAPASVSLAFKLLSDRGGLPRADRASVTLTGALTLVLCATAAIPLYLLARRTLGPASAWACAACWPLIPAALLFQPTADTAFPFLTLWALVFLSWSEARWGWAIPCGVVLGLGMQATLAFLPAGLIVAVMIFTRRPIDKKNLIRFIAVGVGFLGTTFAAWGLTSANPFAIWWANQRNHAGFYVQFPRSYLAWVAETPIEIAIALGIPVAVWIPIGVRSAPREAVITAGVLAFLLLSGRSLSEVSRLWIPFFPMLLLAIGAGMERAGAKGVSLSATVFLLGIQTLWLQALIQVVYPV